jgi:hypothetical protein
MTRVATIAVLALTLLAASAVPARADITGFFGFSPTPAKHTTKGFSFGISMVLIGFEFEQAQTSPNEAKGAPGVRTTMFNGALQTPGAGTQLYLTGGGGWYKESYRDREDSGVATNVGGGIKIALAGPVRLRLDYRIFNLRNNPLYKNPKRFYAGVNIAF